MLKKLLTDLRSRPSTVEVFNQYRNPALLSNLKLYFEYLQHQRSLLMLVGEAPGYRGCRLTGIPFTSEYIVRNSQHPFFLGNRGRIQVKSEEREATATIVWGFLGLKPLPLVWNAFPFHPHKINEPESNRGPTEEEIQEGKKYVSALREIFHPRQICAVGKVGHRALSAIFPNEKFECVRHPANGGKKEFIAGLNRIESFKPQTGL